MSTTQVEYKAGGDGPGAEQQLEGVAGEMGGAGEPVMANQGWAARSGAQKSADALAELRRRRWGGISEEGDAAAEAADDGEREGRCLICSVPPLVLVFIAEL